jgi:dihydroflavonol-4-reductase
MKIFITGSTGFIGTHLVKQLSQTDHRLFCLARKTSDIKVLNEIGATIITGEVTDRDTLIKGMNDCDAVIHLASSFVFWVSNKRIYTEVNIDGTRNVMESVLETGISKVVSVSTVGVYGNAKWPINEDSPYGTKRASRYCQTKYEGDLITWQLYKEEGLPLVMIHPSAVIGPNDPKAAGRYIKNYALGRMPAQVLTKAIFPWVHVKDVCKVIIKVLEKENNIGERYLVSNENLTFGEINNIISEISGKNLPKLKFPDWLTMLNAYLLTGLANLIRKPPIWDMSVDQISLMKQGFKVDGGKAERELGFTYTPVRIGIKDAIASFT